MASLIGTLLPHYSYSWMIMRFGKGKRLVLPYLITITACLWEIFQRIETEMTCSKSLQSTHVSWQLSLNQQAVIKWKFSGRDDGTKI